MTLQEIYEQAADQLRNIHFDEKSGNEEKVVILITMNEDGGISAFVRGAPEIIGATIAEIMENQPDFDAVVMSAVVTHIQDKQHLKVAMVESIVEMCECPSCVARRKLKIKGNNHHIN